MPQTLTFRLRKSALRAARCARGVTRTHAARVHAYAPAAVVEVRWAVEARRAHVLHVRGERKALRLRRQHLRATGVTHTQPPRQRAAGARTRARTRRRRRTQNELSPSPVFFPGKRAALR
jgi:hypothetical protein